MRVMRVAVPTNDGKSISEHFGRSAAFLVFEIENGQIKSREMRTNAMQHSHGKGDCDHGPEGRGQHNHAGILSSLSDCDAVICTGMGWRAAEALKSGGIAPVLVAATGSAQQAVMAYLKGDVTTGSRDYCRCTH